MSFAFINIYNTLDEALSVRYSPLTNIYKNNGIQLLPLQSNKYVQTSYISGNGIELEDWEVFAVSARGTERTNITANFFVERVFEDDNGIPQIDWSLKNLPELGYGLIYLEINQLMMPSGYADTWYSSLFQVTAYEAESTARIDYRDYAYDTMQSIQFQMYFWQNDRTFELSSYREVSTSITKTVTSRSSKFEVWNTQVMDREMILKLTELFDLTFMYVDYIRCFPFEASEINRLEQAENYTDYSFTLSFDRKDIYDPNFVPAPIPLTPSIVLNQAMDLGLRKVSLDFSYYNFNPSFLTAQYEFAPGAFPPGGQTNNWVGYNISTESPVTNELNAYGNYYVRIYSLEQNIASNVLQISLVQPLIISSATINRTSNTPAKYIITVNYNTSYFTSSEVSVVVTASQIVFTRPNTGQVIIETDINIGNVGQVVPLFVRNPINAIGSETRNVTIIQI